MEQPATCRLLLGNDVLLLLAALPFKDNSVVAFAAL